MANLIITIISIALVAVATIVGAYYGGIAFQNYQAKAQVLAISNKMGQIVTAVKLWEGETGQNFVNTYYNTSAPYYGSIPKGAFNVLVPKYLQSDDFQHHQIIATPSYDDSDDNHAGDAHSGLTILSQSNPYQAQLNDGPYYLSVGINFGNISAADKPGIVNLCKAAISMARGTGQAAVSWSNRKAGGQFDCEITNNGASPDDCLINNCGMVFNYKM